MTIPEILRQISKTTICHNCWLGCCFTWDICTARVMEIIAYDMIREGDYYG